MSDSLVDSCRRGRFKPRQYLSRLALLLLLACGAPDIAAAETAASLKREPLQPLPPQPAIDTGKVELGRQLFHDARLSRDGTVSCASCHNLSLGGTDRRAKSTGIGGAPGKVNAPTVFNAALNFRQFWDGRAASLEDQVDGPTQAPDEMGADWPTIVGRLRATPRYVAMFAQEYPDGISRRNVKHAIAEFERSLLTPNARFDRYLHGETAALNASEQSGYRKFKAYGCVSCHQGANVGGNMFQRMGAIGDYFADRGNVTSADFGRYNITGDEADRYSFKVPSLRNVAVTPPYFHDGSAVTLEQAVAVMGRYQLGRDLPMDDINEIAAFLRTLTGQYQGKPL